MTDIPEEFQDVPRLPNGKPDLRTKRGKELKAFLSQPVVESEPYGYCPQCGQAGVNRERRPDGNDICAAGHMYPTAEALSVEMAAELVRSAIMDGGGTEEAGDERFPQEGLPTFEDVRGIIPFVPQPSLGTSQSGQWLLAQIAEAYPEVRYNQWNRVKATFVHAQRNLLAWRRLTHGR